MLIDRHIITDGHGIMSYLDDKIAEIVKNNKMATGIIIGTRARKRLSERCQIVMGMKKNNEETVNKYHGVILIEDSLIPDRVEIVVGDIPPVIDTAMFGGLK